MFDSLHPLQNVVCVPFASLISSKHSLYISVTPMSLYACLLRMKPFLQVFGQMYKNVVCAGFKF
jgi:hypothetical protein